MIYVQKTPYHIEQHCCIIVECHQFVCVNKKKCKYYNFIKNPVVASYHKSVIYLWFIPKKTVVI